MPRKFHPGKQFALDEFGCVRFAAPDGRPVVNRQALGPTWIGNGLCYAVRVAALRAHRSILGSAARSVVTAEPVVNIDRAADPEHAGRLLEAPDGETKLTTIPSG